jgi:hypothetical protein
VKPGKEATLVFSVKYEGQATASPVKLKVPVKVVK